MKIKYFFLLLILLITGCNNNFKDEAPEEVFFELENKLEVFSEKKIKDIVLSTNAEIINEDFIITSDIIGLNKYEFEYKYNNKKYVYNFEMDIIDSKEPFIFGSTTLTLLKGSEDKLCDLISYGDNYDSKAKCEIEGVYNPSILGAYNLKMIVTDSSNNIAEKDITVNIVSKKSSSGSSSDKRFEFADLKSKYQGENIEYGIDVSSWQEDIDFEAVKTAGASFVMIRLGFQKGSDRTLKLDSFYSQNIERAKRAGLKVGIYLYSTAITVSEAKEHASWLLNELKGTTLELPIVFDWENWSTFNEYNMSFYELNGVANAFISTINNKGYKGSLYSSKYYLENIWESAKNNPVWLAHYTENTSYQGEYFMWQLSNTGKIPGIAGPVDLNLLYTDKNF